MRVLLPGRIRSQLNEKSVALFPHWKLEVECWNIAYKAVCIQKTASLWQKTCLQKDKYIHVTSVIARQNSFCQQTC